MWDVDGLGWGREQEEVLGRVEAGAVPGVVPTHLELREGGLVPRPREVPQGSWGRRTGPRG